MRLPMNLISKLLFKSHRSSKQLPLRVESVAIKHLAIIMDGNGRWAKKRSLPRTSGHKEGLERVKEIIRTVSDLEIPYLTLYAFSTENWKRPEDEVDYLMQLFEHVLDHDLLELMENHVRLRFIGIRDGLSPRLIESMERAESLTMNNTRLQLNLAVNYGSRAELTFAIRNIVQKALDEGLDPQCIDEKMVDEHLWTTGIPDPDLLIRPSGEQRLSNFLLWQCAYTEFYFTSTFWPDFDRAELEKAIQVFSERDRRFGRIKGE